MAQEYLLRESLKEAEGFFGTHERAKPDESRVQEVIDLFWNHKLNGQRLSGNQASFLMKEALTTSDFPYLMGDVLDRQMLATYQAVTPVWQAFTKMGTVNKIDEDARMFAVYGGDNNLARVGEKGEYLASPRNELRYLIQANKRGRQFDISWEALINDDLDALKDTPDRFARAVIRTRHRIMTTLYASDVGAHVEGNGGNLYAVGTNAAATALSITALQVGVQTMNMFTDIGGEPIDATPITLVVGPALEFTARSILNSAMYQMTTAAGVPMPTANVIAQAGLNLVVDKYLPVVNTGNDQHTQWYLFADPNVLPALKAVNLSGHELPEIAMKASDKVSPAGGLMSPFSGDFATDNVFYRVRDVFGGAKLDWRGTYMGGYLA